MIFNKILPQKILNKILAIIRVNFYYNTVNFQKYHWATELAKYDWSNAVLYGNDWGDPNNADDQLGNYKWIRDELTGYAKNNFVILEIGSLGGKWTQYLLNAKKIICVDINSVGFDYIRHKLPYPNIEFYLTKGDELKGIPSNNVNFIFSMDTLVRVPKKYIYAYFLEAYRVLNDNGEIFLHLPCNSKADSRRRKFTSLTKNNIMSMAKKSGFSNIYLEENMLVHGVICRAKKIFNMHYHAVQPPSTTRLWPVI